MRVQAKRAEREIKALRAEIDELCETGAKVREERDQAQVLSYSVLGSENSDKFPSINLFGREALPARG